MEETAAAARLGGGALLRALQCRAATRSAANACHNTQNRPGPPRLSICWRPRCRRHQDWQRRREQRHPPTRAACASGRCTQSGRQSPGHPAAARQRRPRRRAPRSGCPGPPSSPAAAALPPADALMSMSLQLWIACWWLWRLPHHRVIRWGPLHPEGVAGALGLLGHLLSGGPCLQVHQVVAALALLRGPGPPPKAACPADGRAELLYAGAGCSRWTWTSGLPRGISGASLGWMVSQTPGERQQRAGQRAHLKLWDRRCVVQEVAATVPSATDDRPPPTRLMEVCTIANNSHLCPADTISAGLGSPRLAVMLCDQEKTQHPARL